MEYLSAVHAWLCQWDPGTYSPPSIKKSGSCHLLKMQWLQPFFIKTAGMKKSELIPMPIPHFAASVQLEMVETTIFGKEDLCHSQRCIYHVPTKIFAERFHTLVRIAPTLHTSLLTKRKVSQHAFLASHRMLTHLLRLTQTHVLSFKPKWAILPP